MNSEIKLCISLAILVAASACTRKNSEFAKQQLAKEFATTAQALDGVDGGAEEQPPEEQQNQQGDGGGDGGDGGEGGGDGDAGDAGDAGDGGDEQGVNDPDGGAYEEVLNTVAEEYPIEVTMVSSNHTGTEWGADNCDEAQYPNTASVLSCAADQRTAVLTEWKEVGVRERPQVVEMLESLSVPNVNSIQTILKQTLHVPCVTDTSPWDTYVSDLSVANNRPGGSIRISRYMNADNGDTMACSVHIEFQDPNANPVKWVRATAVDLYSGTACFGVGFAAFGLDFASFNVTGAQMACGNDTGITRWIGDLTIVGGHI